MKIPLFTLMAVFVAFSLTAALAQDKTTPPPSPSPAPSPSASPSPKPGVYDYQDLPINDVLRELGRSAKVNLTIGYGVNGNVTLHLENKSPIQAIEAVANARNLLFKEFEGAYYVVTQDDWREIMRNRFFFEAPELPVALAKYQKRYYDALVKEGFTKDEALKIIMTQPLPPRDSRYNF
jgi:hypothetical protein